MDEWWMASACGAASGALLLLARRVPLLAWVALAPLGMAVVIAGPGPAAFGGGLAGALANVAAVWSRTMRRALLPLNVGLGAVAWAIAFGAGAFVQPNDAPAWVVLVLPASVLLALVPARLAGAPRWVSNPIACTQEGWLALVHTARLGGDLFTAAIMAVGSAAVALVGLVAVGEASTPSSLLAAGGGVVVMTAVLVLGALSARAAARRVDASATMRVAAVVADGPKPPEGVTSGLWPIRSPAYRDVEATVQRYEPHVARAAGEGARVVVLPEVCVNVDARGRARWLDAVTRWAREHGITVVAPYFDGETPRNELVVVGPQGLVGTYEKQHPGLRMEPPRTRRMPPGPHPLAHEPAALSTVICVDLDYADLVGPVRAAGGLLTAPSNDWLDGFEELHHRTAVWAAVLTGMTTLRATGHGISSAIDGAGRVIACASSAEGPVVLVVDAPLTTARLPTRDL